jgi:hypothetical protein
MERVLPTKETAGIRFVADVAVGERWNNLTTQ